MTTFTGEIHPFADRFPMLVDEDLADLVDDIRENGLLQPIVLDPSGVLLDGRNRLAACEQAEVEPEFVVHEGDPFALIVSANVRRRQMTPGQQAVATGIALAARGMRENGRWKHGVVKETMDQYTVSNNALAWAGVVLDWDTEHGSDLATQVLTGALVLKDAYRTVKAQQVAIAEAEAVRDRARKQADEQAELDRATFNTLRRSHPDIAELVRLEKLTLPEAVAAAKRQTEEKEAAERAALNAWTEANDAALTVLSWLASEAPIPSKVPDGYPDRATFKARIQKIAAILKERKA